MNKNLKKNEKWIDRKRKINLLISKSSWIYHYRFKLKQFLKQKKNIVKIIFNHKSLSKADLSFVISYYKIIPKEFLIKSKMNLVIHESDLPLGRGFAPLTWQILNGKNKITFSLFDINLLSKVSDSGNILLKSKINLSGGELIDEIRNLTVNEYKKIINRFFSCSVNFRGKKQKGKSSYFKRRKPQDSKIRVNQNIKKIFNLLRVVDNTRYPAFFYYRNLKYYLKITKNEKD